MVIMIQHTKEQAMAEIRFDIDNQLWQRWIILEWGNLEGVGRPMNTRKEWRKVPTGRLD